MKFQYGDILCFRPTGIVGELIVAIDSKGLGDYSHNAIFWKYEQGIPLFLEAHEKNGRGVGIVKLQEHWNNYDVFRCVDLDVRPDKEMLDKLGNMYSRSRLFKIFMFRVFGVPIKSDNVDETICTEYVNFCFKYKLLTPGYETPWELQKLIRNNPKRFITVYKSPQVI